MQNWASCQTDLIHHSKVPWEKISELSDQFPSTQNFPVAGSSTSSWVHKSFPAYEDISECILDLILADGVPLA